MAYENKIFNIIRNQRKVNENYTKILSLLCPKVIKKMAITTTSKNKQTKKTVIILTKKECSYTDERNVNKSII